MAAHLAFSQNPPKVGSSNAHPHQEGTPFGGRGREGLGGSSSRGRRSSSRSDLRLHWLEEERKKEAEIKVAELEARMAKSISEVMIRTMEEFKPSSKMRNLNVEFGQQMFIKGFELHEG
ncbi:hypothetical protein COCNU_scaffold021309G000010 [Cocos nucifera]|nr:hypothetical protein [Cocos nucifera]